MPYHSAKTQSAPDCRLTFGDIDAGERNALQPAMGHLPETPKPDCPPELSVFFKSASACAAAHADRTHLFAHGGDLGGMASRDGDGGWFHPVPWSYRI